MQSPLQHKLYSVASGTTNIRSTLAWSPCGTHLAIALGNERVLVHDRHGTLIEQISLKSADVGSGVPTTKLRVRCILLRSTRHDASHQTASRVCALLCSGIHKVLYWRLHATDSQRSSYTLLRATPLSDWTVV